MDERVLVLTHNQNKGKGRALKTGLLYIQKHISGELYCSDSRCRRSA